MKDLRQSFSLSRIRPFFDDDLLRAAALGHLTRPVHEHRPVQAAEIGVVEGSLFDMTAHRRLAVAMGGFGAELAWAPPGTVASRELRTANQPSISHRSLLVPHSRQFALQVPAMSNNPCKPELESD